ncbi:KRAB-A domain-containing protein 2-like [Macrobrachium rosenbergii]|uniref:KRAB-A domain-containing protein 2-like n=1 Tax=Macrobrachium rosenbergii TaxID=79674 RepID=UPI0034D4705B
MDSEARREQHFVEELKKWHSKNKRVLITRDEYFETVNELITSQETKVKNPRQYYLIKKYDLLNCGDTQKLIRKRKDEKSEPVYFVFIEETFSILKRAHILTGHGGRDKMIKNLSEKYANITQESINLFKAGCIECQKKKRRPTTKGTVVRPILTKEFGTRGQVDLIDMQSIKGRFSWIMVYQDHLTKFIVLRRLTSKRAAEVAYQLLDIFLLFGAPQILQSDNGSEFTAQVIEELKVMWPQLLWSMESPGTLKARGQ